MERVKWGSNDKFSKVKMIVAEDCLSQIAKPEDHLQIKDTLYTNQTTVHTHPQIKWECPPLFTLNSEWQVVAGEESEEKKTQNFRQRRVLEASYPCLSAIPPSPSVSSKLEVSEYDDTQTPIIPLFPIEDEDTTPTESTPNTKSIERIVPIDSNPIAKEVLQILPACLDADVFAAASVALTAMLKSNEKDSMVDTGLLIKMLKEPKMFETLSKVSIPNPKPNTFASRPFSDTSSISVSVKSADSQPDLSRNVVPASSDLFIRPDRLPLQNPRILGMQSSQSSLVSTSDTRMHMASTTSNSVSRNPMDSCSDILSRTVLPVSSSEAFRPDRLSLQSSRSLPVSPEIPTFSSYLPSHSSGNSPVIKDVNYYKSLVRLHGMEGNITEEHSQVSADELTFVSGQVSAAEITTVSVQGQAKPCRFYNSSKGCRNGSACPFEHVSLPNLQAGNFVDPNKNKRLKISAGTLCWPSW